MNSEFASARTDCFKSMESDAAMSTLDRGTHIPGSGPGMSELPWTAAIRCCCKNPSGGMGVELLHVFSFEKLPRIHAYIRPLSTAGINNVVCFLNMRPHTTMSQNNTKTTRQSVNNIQAAIKGAAQVKPGRGRKTPQPAKGSNAGQGTGSGLSNKEHHSGTTQPRVISTPAFTGPKGKEKEKISRGTSTAAILGEALKDMDHKSQSLVDVKAELVAEVNTLSKQIQSVKKEQDSIVPAPKILSPKELMEQQVELDAVANQKEGSFNFDQYMDNLEFERPGECFDLRKENPPQTPTPWYSVFSHVASSLTGTVKHVANKVFSMVSNDSRCESLSHPHTSANPNTPNVNPGPGNEWRRALNVFLGKGFKTPSIIKTLYVAPLQPISPWTLYGYDLGKLVLRLLATEFCAWIFKRIMSDIFAAIVARLPLCLKVPEPLMAFTKKVYAEPSMVALGWLNFTNRAYACVNMARMLFKGVLAVGRDWTTQRRDMVLIPFRKEENVIEQVASFNTEVLKVKQVILDCQPAIRSTCYDGTIEYHFDWDLTEPVDLFVDKNNRSSNFREMKINLRQLPELLNQKTLLAGKAGSGFVQELNRLKRFFESDSKHGDTYRSILAGNNSASDTYIYSMCRSTDRLDPDRVLRQDF